MKIIILQVNCGEYFNSINSEIIERKFTKFVHDLAELLPFNHLKADLWSFNLLSNAKG